MHPKLPNLLKWIDFIKDVRNIISIVHKHFQKSDHKWGMF